MAEPRFQVWECSEPKTPWMVVDHTRGYCVVSRHKHLEGALAKAHKLNGPASYTWRRRPHQPAAAQQGGAA